MDDHFTFLVDELAIDFGGATLELAGTHTVTCEGGNDGRIIAIEWAGGSLDNCSNRSLHHRLLFLAMSRAIYEQCKSTIAEGVAETPYRIRERSDERRAELAMGK